MSGPVVTLDNVEGARSCAERTRSLDAITDKDNGSILTNGEAVHGSETAAFRVGELLLPNGDLYSGSLLGNVPEGRGKYVWKVGCVYEGEWRRGMRQGTGKIQWPSGTVYDGELSGGYMHGTGTYIDSNKLTYKGRWKLNLKHGLGYQVYPNGDVFEGAWIQGTPEGPGKYTWANGNVYLGNMKGGKMSGKGTLTWTNGDSFEGSWLNGMMHGLGVYNWRDGGCYVGTWTRGLKDGKGSFYPKGSRLPALQEVYLNALRKRGLLPDLRKQNHSHIHHASSVDMGSVKVGGTRVSHRNSGEGNLLNLEQSRNRNVSLERRWSLEVSIEKVIGYDSSLELTESFIEGEEKGSETNAPVLEREYMQGVLISEFVLNNSFSASSRRAKRRQKMLAKEVKRPGEIIIKGHRSYDLMLSLQLGIRYTVGKITPVQRREVRVSDFGRRASFWMNFPKEGSQLTPPHQSEDFKWKDYCPMVFRNLREMFKIDAADYMISICGNDVLRELSSPGKSGSIFFLSQDDRFMIKTLRKSEVKVLLRMLPNYHHHVRSYENTLITKFFGLHRIKPSSGQKFRFVVMGNMFCTELRIHRRFDLKGSSLGRSADNIEIDENTTLKDLDLNYCFYLEPSWQEALLRQIETDKEDGISNYPQGLVLVPRGTDDSVVVGPHIRGRRLRASSAGDEEVDLLLPGTARLQIQLGVNMPARAELIPGKEENMFHEAYDVVLYLGMIDILQEYNMTKKIEHAYKSLQFDSVSISAVDPTFYSQRFLEFIQKVFPENSIKG
ncbi:phosphatidylinositol 4-phosphate 5-kinase 9 isoform X5 [Gossypium hirsutum]|uniref:Phosphatidylinositol 4-phosphate 5-kinase n=1 Tax=Gossypium hirsutum TaxID=3635 RepID=A0ABM3BIU7_GOSHI|nr:phosphatidylinositol 4-phosphate 5-kinase 9 isoform X5 [Gossypium hirsutum]